jgi:hypothetical protein
VSSGLLKIIKSKREEKEKEKEKGWTSEKVSDTTSPRLSDKPNLKK